MGNVGLLCGVEWMQDDLKHSRQSGQRCLAFDSGLEIDCGGGTEKGEISNINKWSEIEMSKSVNTHWLRQGEKDWMLFQQG